MRLLLGFDCPGADALAGFWSAALGLRRRALARPAAPAGARGDFSPAKNRTPGDGAPGMANPGGTLGGMRRKTSLTLDETTIAAARAGAEQDGKPLSQWVEQAILNEVGRSDVAVIEEWERTLADEDQAVLAAFAEADRLADLDR
jgi:hypothetical protein